MNFQRRTDLACEKILIEDDKALQGINCFEKQENGVKLFRMEIESDKGSESAGYPKGRYTTISFGNIWLLDQKSTEDLVGFVSDEIKYYVKKISCGREIGDLSVLVCGLGNSDITSDAIGPQTVKRLSVTRHLKEEFGQRYNAKSSCCVSAVAPGVLGQTGIETVELIKGTVRSISPDIIIAIDALAAGALERLASTVQLSDTGISPGSGIGNERKGINSGTVGVPVLAIGVPTVVDSSTLVYDTLERAGITSDKIDKKLKKVLEEGRGYFVAPKESDVISRLMSIVLARSISMALGID